MPALRRSLLALALVTGIQTHIAAQRPEPRWLRDRGPGIPTSQFGTYIRRGELLVYPFVEHYWDANYEYKPSELGYGLDVDHRGYYFAREALLFLGYGITDNLAVELEGAWIGAELEKGAGDPSSMPAEVEESGLGDVEAQLRWRIRTENGRRPEMFTYFETVFPFQKSRRLIGTRDWEWKLGFGMIRGFGWGTVTLRSGVEYVKEEGKFEVGEYAMEYLRRISNRVRAFAMVEGNQLDEVAFITEVQWRIAPRAWLKLNNGWGLTRNATDFAPEVGVLLAF